MMAGPQNQFARGEGADVPSWWARPKAVNKATLRGWDAVLYDIAWEEAHKQVAQQHPAGKCPRRKGCGKK